ncbi:HAD hydrolase-like protein [Orrella sp. JC864]|uniref:HAD hydrolase-like protein n=1 Tax=Orrella sp. JC864 TaxID=3120298 RepID=UPI0030083EDC
MRAPEHAARQDRDGRRPGAGSSRYALVALDFDGTLADTLPWFEGIVGDVCARYGLRVPDAAARQAMRHSDAREIFRRLALPLWKLPQVMAYLRQRMAQDAPRIELFDGMAAALRAMRGQGVQLALLSSNSAANVRRVLGEALWPCFAYQACGSDVFGKAGKLRRLMRQAGVAPGRVLLVGDELRDIEAARQAGVSAGAVAWGYNVPQALRAAGPDVLFDTPADIAAYVLQSYC